MTSESIIQETQCPADLHGTESASPRTDAALNDSPAQPPAPAAEADGSPPAASGSVKSAALPSVAESSAAPDTVGVEGFPSAASDSLEPAVCPSVAEADEGEGEISFAEMLERHEREEAPHARLTPGQRVSVRVVAITGDTIFVSTGSKVDGIVDREELEADGELSCQIGDMLDLYVVTTTPQEVKLSKILRGAGSLAALEEAREAGLPVEGKVTAQVKGGYAVEIMKRRAFCPLSQIDLRPPDDPEAHVGGIWPFLITRLEKGGRNIVVSRRTLLEREQAENREALLERTQEGDVIEGVVSRLAPFGAFIELAPGVEGMVHLSELSWIRVGRADEAVSVGDRVRVKILGIGKEEKNTRISLSIRQVMDDPWKDVPDRLTAGEVVTGKVVRNAPFGAFVEVLPGVEGLVHLSELSFEKRVLKADEVVVPGDVVSVKIKELDPQKRRISLSLRDAAGNPWDNVHESLPLDADITGTVEKRAPFGLFVTLSPGLTGLLPNAAIQASPSRRTLERLGAGDAVGVRVKGIDSQNRRIALVPVGEADSQGEKDWKSHAPKPSPAPSMGALGLALQAAMKKKK